MECFLRTTPKVPQACAWTNIYWHTHKQACTHTHKHQKSDHCVSLTNVLLDQWGLGKRLCTWQTETKSKVVFTWPTTSQTVLTWHTTVQRVLSQKMVVKYKHQKAMLPFLLVLKTGLETPKWLRGQWKPFLFLWNSALNKKLVTFRHT